MMFLLKELSLVDEAELKNILSMFEAIDTNGDGVLSMDDVRQVCLLFSFVDDWLH